jgi:hypothetical protein
MWARAVAPLGRVRLRISRPGQAVVLGPVAVEEEAALAGQGRELGSFEPCGGPVDLAHRAGPALVLEGRAEPFGEAAVELGVVGGDDHGRLDEGGHLVGIDALAGHHFVGDAGDAGDLLGDRHRGLAQLDEGGSDAAEAALRVVAERDHGQFDDLVAGRVLARGLHVQIDALAQAVGVVVREQGVAGQPAQQAVVAAGLQLAGQDIQGVEIEVGDERIGVGHAGSGNRLDHPATNREGRASRLRRPGSRRRGRPKPPPLSGSGLGPGAENGARRSAAA